MRFGQSLNASFNDGLQALRSRGTGQAYDCLDDSEQISRPVIDLTREELHVLFQPFPVGDIPDDAATTDNLARGILQKGNREQNVHQTAVLALPDGVARFDAFSAPYPGENRRFLFHPVGRHEHPNGFPDDLFGRIAVEAFRPLVPCRDDCREIGADDRVVTGLHDLRKAPEAVLAPAQLGRCCLVLFRRSIWTRTIKFHGLCGSIPSRRACFLAAANGRASKWIIFARGRKPRAVLLALVSLEEVPTSAMRLSVR